MAKYPFWFTLTPFYQANLACAVMRHYALWQVAEGGDPKKWKAHEDVIAAVYDK
jgi:hypothetical protein